MARFIDSCDHLAIRKRVSCSPHVQHDREGRLNGKFPSHLMTSAAASFHGAAHSGQSPLTQPEFALWSKGQRELAIPADYFFFLNFLVAQLLRAILSRFCAPFRRLVIA